MIPIRLEISGFLSYREPVTIDFTSFELACISGHNGAGKSSILDALTWVLFGEARQRGDAVINAQSDAAEVNLIFEYEGNRYHVQRRKEREKTGHIEFHIAPPTSTTDDDAPAWRPLTERTMRATQQRIIETLRLDYETFVNAAFFLQGKADQFTQQRPAERKRILSNILGLEIWETYRQRAAAKRRVVQAEIKSLGGHLKAINEELAEEGQRKEHLRQLEAALKRIEETRALQEQALESIRQAAARLEEQRQGVTALAARLAENRRQLTELQEVLSERQKDRQEFADLLAQAEAIQEAYQAWQAAREELARWEESAGRFREFEQQRQGPLTAIEAERARLTQEMETLLAQQSALAEKQAEQEILRQQVAAMEKELAALQEQVETRQALQDELETARQRQAEARAENPRLKAQMDELKNRIDRLSAVEGAACPLCGQPLSTEERERLIARLNAEGKEMGNRYRANTQLLNDAEARVKDLQAQLAAFASLDETLRQTIRTFVQITARIHQIETEIAEWEQTGSPRLAELQRALAEEDFAPEARAELQKIDAQLKELGYDAAAHDAVRQAEREGRTAEESLRELEKARAALEPLDREIASLQKQIEALKATHQHEQKEYEKAQQALAEAEAVAPDLRQAQRDLLDIQEEENKLRMDVGAARQKVDVLDDLRARARQLESEREALSGQVARLQQLENACGRDGVPALLIEQALPSIEARANEILDRLSGGEMSVRFETQRELKTRDDLKETLEIRISDRAGTRDYEMYSGGEAFRANFAIRLALSELLARRAGARLQTLVIDEGFGSQDEIGRQRLIEAINIIKADFAKILVITHIDSLKDAFPARIEVEKTPRGSMVQVI